MKKFRPITAGTILHSAFLLLFIGTAATLSAQEGERGKKEPDQKQGQRAPGAEAKQHFKGNQPQQQPARQPMGNAPHSSTSAIGHLNAQHQPQPKSLQRQIAAQPRENVSKSPTTPLGYLNAQHQPQAESRGTQGRWQQHRATNWQSEHRNWEQRGGYRGSRIPESRFRGYYGEDHHFRIYSMGLGRSGRYFGFRHDGYWFSIIDPWPEDWADNWYENDDVFIEFSNGGYYLYNRNHPGIAIAVSVR